MSLYGPLRREIWRLFLWFRLTRFRASRSRFATLALPLWASPGVMRCDFMARQVTRCTQGLARKSKVLGGQISDKLRTVWFSTINDLAKPSAIIAHVEGSGTPAMATRPMRPVAPE